MMVWFEPLLYTACSYRGGGGGGGGGRVRDSWSGGLGFDRPRQKSWSPYSVSYVAALKIVRGQSCLGTRPRYSLVVVEDVKKPNKQTSMQLSEQGRNFVSRFSMPLCFRICSNHSLSFRRLLIEKIDNFIKSFIKLYFLCLVLSSFFIVQVFKSVNHQSYV